MSVRRGSPPPFDTRTIRRPTSLLRGFTRFPGGETGTRLSATAARRRCPSPSSHDRSADCALGTAEAQILQRAVPLASVDDQIGRAPVKARLAPHQQTQPSVARGRKVVRHSVPMSVRSRCSGSGCEPAHRASAPPPPKCCTGPRLDNRSARLPKERLLTRTMCQFLKIALSKPVPESQLR
jgi:hypothetical protein